MALGGNFLSATPDTAVTTAALAGCDLTVHVSTKLNRSHLHPGTPGADPAVPRANRGSTANAPAPQVVSVEDSMSVVHPSRGRLEPASPDLLSEVSIVCRLARRTLGDDAAAALGASSRTTTTPSATASPG